MKQLFIKTLAVLTLITVITTGVGYVAHAQATGSTAGTIASAIGGPVAGAVANAVTSATAHTATATFLDFAFGTLLKFAGGIVYLTLSSASFFLSLAAAALNVSIYLTTHLENFIASTPAIYTVWTILRDISGMLFIFILLWAAFQTILDLKGADYGTQVKNIIVVGILINFSFFFTTVMIDISNLVSLQLYDSIAPASAAACSPQAQTVVGGANASFLACVTSSVIQNPHGGLADVIVQSLDVTQWYGNKNQLNGIGSDIDAGTRLLLINIAAIFVVMFAALSFLGAAAACIWRICSLILLLAFSPLWILGYALPEIKKEVSDKWVKHLQANLIFLPVYLLLMYVVIRILQTMNLAQLGAGNVGLVTGTQSGGITWYLPYMQLFVGFAIIIFLINVPLFSALSFAGAAGTPMEKWAKGVRGTIGSVIGRNTAGRWATQLDKRLGNTYLGNSMLGREIRGVTTKQWSESKYGGSRSYLDVQKENKDIARKNKEIARTNKLDRITGNGPINSALRLVNPSSTADYKKAVDAMNKDQKLALGFDRLKDIEVLKHLKGSDFEAISKSEEFSDSEKDQIKKLRTDALNDAVAKGQGDVIKHMVGEMEAKDLMKTGTTLTNVAVIDQLKPSQLRAMADDGIDAATRSTIATRIRANPTHKAFGWINSPENRAIWV